MIAGFRINAPNYPLAQHYILKVHTTDPSATESIFVEVKTPDPL